MLSRGEIPKVKLSGSAEVTMVNTPVDHVSLTQKLFPMNGKQQEGQQELSDCSSCENSSLAFDLMIMHHHLDLRAICQVFIPYCHQRELL